MEKSGIIQQFKKQIPFETKVQFQLQKLKYRSRENSFIKWNGKKRRVYIFLAADYGNLGDVAITYAQHCFLQQAYPDCQVIEIPISCTLEGIVTLKKHIGKDDIVTTVGGGNTGDLYHQIEYFRQLVIQNFPNNPIISFPQTIDFSETELGQKRLQKAIKTYGNHPKLTLIAREQRSYNFYNKHFSNKVVLLPDIVTTLDRSHPVFERQGAVICLRNDREKKLNPEQESELIDYVKGHYKNYHYYDTHVGGQKLSMKRRLTALFHIWDVFKKAELVITDRLHGMIFCHITNTPALVFLNNNHKIEQSYEWIKHNPRIKLVKEYHFGTIAKNIHDLDSSEVTSTISLIDKYSNFKSLV